MKTILSTLFNALQRRRLSGTATTVAGVPFFHRRHLNDSRPSPTGLPRCAHCNRLFTPVADAQTVCQACEDYAAGIQPKAYRRPSQRPYGNGWVRKLT